MEAVGARFIKLIYGEDDAGDAILISGLVAKGGRGATAGWPGPFDAAGLAALSS